MGKRGPKSRFRDPVNLNCGNLLIERDVFDLINRAAVRLDRPRTEIVRRLIAKGIQQLKKEAAK